MAFIIIGFLYSSQPQKYSINGEEVYFHYSNTSEMHHIMKNQDHILKIVLTDEHPNMYNNKKIITFLYLTLE